MSEAQELLAQFQANQPTRSELLARLARLEYRKVVAHGKLPDGSPDYPQTGLTEFVGIQARSQIHHGC